MAVTCLRLMTDLRRRTTGNDRTNRSLTSVFETKKRLGFVVRKFLGASQNYRFT